MDLMTVVRIASVLAIALAYMAFDLLNKRNVPTKFVYGTIAYGALLTLLYMNYETIGFSLGIAGVVFGLGYLVYKAGQIGLGDVAEFTAISMMLPFQGMPFLVAEAQYGLPFILSVVIASGIAALIMVPLFYIPMARRKLGSARIEGRGSIAKAAAIGGAYIVFMGFLAFEGMASVYGLAVLGALAFGCVLVTAFEGLITGSMVKWLPASRLEPEDMLAMSMLPKAERVRLKRSVVGFGQLVTPRMISEMKREAARVRLPVYRNGVPFAAPIFVGIVLSLLFGNLMILVI